MGAARILVVDDDPTVAEVVARYLLREGYEVTVAHDGPDALRQAERLRPDLVVLDVLLPSMHGLEVLTRVRRDGAASVVLLTARGEEEDRVAGLRLGADDYVVKPFSPRELVARVRAVLRRSPPTTDGPAATDGALRMGPVELDAPSRSALVRGEEVSLTTREFDLLSFFLRHPREAFRREHLLERVWGYTVGDTSTVTVHVRHLREKIELDPSSPKLLTTVWSVGYRFDPPEDDADDS